MQSEGIWDYVIIGSGFGGSVSAMRLAEKGYRVLVLERGRRFEDHDFAKTNWNLKRYLWAPLLNCFGILEMTLLNGLMVFHGSGVGGGSLGYAGVLMEPSHELFEAPAWRHLADWKTLLHPHYQTARRMLGVQRNPYHWPADTAMQKVASDRNQESTFHLTDVGVYFGEPGELAPDPFFGGEGPARTGCNHCGGCMVGCRYNAKNTLVKNYLYFAEKWGAQIQPEAEVTRIVPLPEGQPDQARYEITYLQHRGWLRRKEKRIRTRNIVLSAGVLGTLRLLFRCRDELKSLPHLSPTLGTMVRTNSEALLGAINPNHEVNYSKGVAITSFFMADEKTAIEPVRFPAGSSLMRFMGAPLLSEDHPWLVRLGKVIWESIRHPDRFYQGYIKRGWAERSTIVLVMQTEDNLMQITLGRHPFTLFRRGLVTRQDTQNGIPAKIAAGHAITRAFAQSTGGVPAGSIIETLLNIPATAHILGGCPFGNNPTEGVIGLDCQVHNYPGLYVVDGSIMPANPGVNPSLTITALAEYAMHQVPVNPDAGSRPSPVKFPHPADKDQVLSRAP